MRPELPSGPLRVVEGDPDDPSLAQARLVPSSCEIQSETRKELIEERVRAMREALKASYEQWRDAQPGCWEMYRERAGDAEYSRHPHRVHSPKSYGPVQATGAAAPVISREGESKEVRSASGTNNQVAGVDEADIVKHDGTHVFLAVNGALRIARIDPQGMVSET